MPKKDTATAVLGMLSSTGSQTRRAGDPVSSPPASTGRPTLPTEPTDAVQPAANALHAVGTSDDTASATAPRTLRLRAGTAARLREAWLHAKRDDVLLTAQDFASDLVEEALRSRARRRGSAQSELPQQTREM